MKKLAVENAVGQALCHDMTAILENGFKGVMFKRGHFITEEDVSRLKDIGKNHVFVWEPEADEVHEEDAALAVSAALCGEGTDYDKNPSEGKVNIFATLEGVFCVNAAALGEINSVPDYTVACLPNYYTVERGMKLAGARIVPLVTKRGNVDAAVSRAKARAPVFSVLPYRPLKCGVIITGDEVFCGRIADRFEPIMLEKIARYGGEVLGVKKCPDDTRKIVEAIERFIAAGTQLVFLTGGMSVDPDDVTPTAIRLSGAEIITQGVPMQPGNMLTLARLGDATLIGVPGASMHSKTTSLEVLLPRIFAGLEIMSGELAQHGVGGLCLGCEECRFPRCYFGK